MGKRDWIKLRIELYIRSKEFTKYNSTTFWEVRVGVKTATIELLIDFLIG